MQKTSEIIIRKLALPLQIKIGEEPMISDGFFKLTSKDVSQLNVLAIDGDGYAKCEIIPPSRDKTPSAIHIVLDQDTFLGTTASKTRGSGKSFGQYRFYKHRDGSYYALTSNNRRIHVGKATDHNGSISIAARIIISNFNSNEFTKEQLIHLLPKNLSHGQMLKALLDVMHIEGFLEKREPTIKGRLRELFRDTDKLKTIITASPEQT
jgi:hypothetical protein